MSNKTIITWGIIGFIVVLTVGVISKIISTKNQEVSLYQTYTAKQKNVENVFDAMWKIISQKAQITENYKDSFKEVFTEIMSERYSKGDGTLMKWIQESNPNFDTSLYENLMNTIESQRTSFMNEQKELLDVVREYNTFVSVFPNSLILSKPLLEAKIITSTRTSEAMKTGKDDDVDLYKKN